MLALTDSQLSTVMAIAEPLRGDRVRRREFITLLGGAPAVGYLHYLAPQQNAHIDATFRAGSTEMGYVEGQNVAIEYRWGEGRAERLPSLAAGRRCQAVEEFVKRNLPE